MSDLRSCPFCGAEATRYSPDEFAYIRCENPKCLISPITDGYTVTSMAINAWNTRHQIPYAEALNKVARAICEASWYGDDYEEIVGIIENKNKLDSAAKAALTALGIMEGR